MSSNTFNNPNLTGNVNFLNASSILGLSKDAVGLGNVDNTPDVNKPISNATQNALNTKAPLSSPSFSGTVRGITKAMVGLSNVDNTSDVNKPISVAMQLALNKKANTSALANYATNSFVLQQIASLINQTPAALDAITRLSSRLNDNPDIATTVIGIMSTKAPIDNPAFTGTVTAPAPTDPNSYQVVTTNYLQDFLQGFSFTDTKYLYHNMNNASPVPYILVALPNNVFSVNSWTIEIIFTFNILRSDGFVRIEWNGDNTQSHYYRSLLETDPSSGTVTPYHASDSGVGCSGNANGPSSITIKAYKRSGGGIVTESSGYNGASSGLTTTSIFNCINQYGGNPNFFNSLKIYPDSSNNFLAGWSLTVLAKKRTN